MALALFPSLLLCLPWPCTQEAPGDPLPAKDAEVTRAELEHHVRFLASDELGGRAPLTAGMDRAAHYLARALEASGVEPAGDPDCEGGGWFQRTGRRRFEYPAVPRLLFTDEAGQEVEARHGLDFTLRLRGSARSTERLPLRFFYDYNHSRMPLTGNAAEAIYFSASRQDKKRILKEKGIASLEDWGLELEIMTGDRGLEAGQPRELLPSRVAAAEGPEACELVELRGPLRTDFERRRFSHVQLLIEEVALPFEDVNVVGRIRGEGTSERPELAQEVVLLSAHYDHLGIREAKNRERADSIFNGADDDASGCAALLELAQALAAGPKPARTLVFLFTTGEESGGAGCQRYIRGPVEPLERTVADLNLEMLGRPDALAGGPGRLWLTGFERSTLGPAWRERDLAIVEDPRPDQRFFQRSDNYALALEGVVAQTLSSFNMHEDYHSPRDEAGTLDYAHLEAAARLALQAATTLADGSLRPAWLEGKQPRRLEELAAPAPSGGERDRKKELRNLGEGGGQKEEGAGKDEEPEEEEPKGG